MPTSTLNIFIPKNKKLAPYHFEEIVTKCGLTSAHTPEMVNENSKVMIGRGACGIRIEIKNKIPKLTEYIGAERDFTEYYSRKGKVLIIKNGDDIANISL